ncbi:hypothetical protein EVAR_62193_1 [Eumeta japonica]|uniref:Uncharacterized protein n=1 Tax=Eumeta variegata TaxID=151549 RepID=A0A4C1Z3J4_EUMVA|nr:hypothetical protein EVAR_62193_1 [Eumeta japonica]
MCEHGLLETHLAAANQTFNRIKLCVSKVLIDLGLEIDPNYSLSAEVHATLVNLDKAFGPVKLAVEIDPLSPKWRSTIEARLSKDQHARATDAPRWRWDAAGMTLYILYVLTTLGHGAAAPRSTGALLATFCYSVVALPVHYCLLWNASKRLVAYAGIVAKRLRDDSSAERLERNAVENSRRRKTCRRLRIRRQSQ